MKKLWNKWTEIALVKRILVGLVLGAILGLTIPGATGISILGDVFVSALEAIAPLLVFFLVISSLCNAGNSHGGVIYQPAIIAQRVEATEVPRHTDSRYIVCGEIIFQHVQSRISVSSLHEQPEAGTEARLQ